MSDQFQVDPEQVRAAARAFAGQQATPGSLASTVDAARGADAGEPALNGQIQVLVGAFLTALTDLATGLGQDASGLAQNAQTYVGADSAMAGYANQIATSAGGRAGAGSGW